MTETLPATADAAERAVLGAVLNAPGTLGQIRLSITGGEFHDPHHAELYALCCDLADAGTRPDPQSVVAELARRGLLPRYGNGTAVTDLWRDSMTAGNVAYHLAEIRTAARIRAVQQAHARLGQAIDEYGAHGNPDQLLENAARQSIALTLAADEPDLDAPVPGVQTWEDFTRPTGDAGSRWIVPGLIRRHDTMLILGSAGSGKSVLSRQVSMCLAAGIHPFTLNRITPVRTLLVDLENAPDQTAEESEPMFTGVRTYGDTEGRGLIWPHPEGLNLRDRADASLLERVIAQCQPDVLCMGSLYNAYRRGRDDWDTAAEDVQGVLKKLRSKYGLGLWLEHHMPRKEGSGHTGTPYGGTAWEKWPTHGRWLRREQQGDAGPVVYLLESTFRGDRGRREIPVALKRGGRLPWTSIWTKDDLAYEMRQIG